MKKLLVLVMAFVSMVSLMAENVVRATLLNCSFAENDLEEQPVVMLSFDDEGFSMPDGSDWGYVFFVPKNENASNLVVCADMDGGSLSDTCDWKYGYPVYCGETEVGPIEMIMLDGDANGMLMEYDIIVRTAQRFDEGELVTNWSSREFSFIVTNGAPNVSAVKMGAETLYESGGDMRNVTLGATKQFAADTDEPSDIDYYADKPDYTNRATAFETRWDFKFGTSTLFTTNIFGPPSMPFNYTFNQQGTYTVFVRMRDKDMDRNRDEWGPAFTFTVNVDSKPSVVLTPKYGTTYFSEYSPDDMSQINVTLTTPPTGRVLVELTIDRDGPYTASSDYPVPTLSKTTLEFKAGETTKSFQLRDLDGTQLTQDYGFLITAAVTNETLNVDGVQWKNVYLPSELNIYLKNKEALFDAEKKAQFSVTTNKSVTVYQKVPPLSIAFNDPSLIDMRSGKTVVEWTSSQGYSDTYFVSNQTATCTITYSDKIAFSKSGFQWVELKVRDKDSDDWTDSVIWYFEIQPTRQLFVTPCGPGSGASIVAEKWLEHAGLGRVWLEDDRVDPKPFSINRFRHFYTYDRTTAIVRAYGYKVADIDNGSLTPSPDWAVTQTGSTTTSPTDCYRNALRATDGKDSFMYMWLQSRRGEQGLETTRIALNPYNPQRGIPGEFVVGLPIELQGDDMETATYPDTYVDAIFSKEYLVTDNIGDINQDSIPDLYAVTRVWGGNSMFETVGGSQAEGMVEGDLYNFHGYNEDGDYLYSNSFEGGLQLMADRSTLGAPFDAELEVRGFHEGLNHRTDSDGLNRFVRGDWVSVPCFSEAETNAVAYWNGVQTWADFKTNNPADGIGYAAAYDNWTNAFWTALMNPSSWIPEKRTDPTLWDTDGDALPDGYEYYFWYRAAVGWMDGVNWVRFTGVRFDQNTNGAGSAITSEEIMAAFDPTVRAVGNSSSRDTDNDGLTDLEEMGLGTNPVNWDTDGDELSDSWEVTYGFNPLVPDMNLLDVPVTIGDKTVSVSAAWINQKLGLSPSWIEKFPNLATAIMSTEAANGRMSVAECYVVGLDPEDEMNDFKVVSLPMKADGTPDLANIVFDPPQSKWNVLGAQPVVKGAESLDGNWHDVDKASEEDRAKYRFFKVVVELP